MRKTVLTFFSVSIMLGSLLLITPNVSACHNLIVSCAPTEKDIVVNITWNVTYEIDLEIKPGCGSIFWVGFTVSAANPKFYRNLYEEGDPNKESIDSSTPPQDGNYHNWDGWIYIGPGNPTVQYCAVLEVWCDPNTVDGSNTTIKVDAWSTDNNNDRYKRTLTTKTTVNIPNGILMNHTDPSQAIQWVEPGKKATFDLTIEDLGNAFGTVILSKSPTSSPCLTDWKWEFSQNPVTLPQGGTVRFTLNVTPPLTAKDGVLAKFVVFGVNNENSSWNHTVWAQTIVKILKPDLSVKNDEEIGKPTLLGKDFSDGVVYNISINIYNLGDKAVSNFEVAFKIRIKGGGILPIGTVKVTETLEPESYINVQHPWKAIEGPQYLAVVLDGDNQIDESDEITNNGVGAWFEIGPPIPKYIILTMSVEPMSIMPECEVQLEDRG